MGKLEVQVDSLSERLIKNDYRNVIFLANNPAITQKTIEGLGLSRDDILVQFNRAPFFDMACSITCHKTHVFNAGGNGSYWGFTKDGKPERDYLNQTFSELSIYFTRWLSKAAENFISELSGDASGGIMYPQWRPPYVQYPQSKIPSVGFQAVAHYKMLNVIRRLYNRPALNLVLVGFSGDYPPGQAWDMHDFNFEQAVYRTWLELCRLDQAGQKTS